MLSLVWCFGRGCCESLYLVDDPASWHCPLSGVTGGIVLTEGNWLAWTNPVSMLSLFEERQRKLGLLVEASRHAGLDALLPPPLVLLVEASRHAGLEVLLSTYYQGRGLPEHRKRLCDLIRDVIGYPCRPVALDAAWQTPAAVALAQTIYDERRFSDLPILADALEEASCDNADLLAHCRGPGPHVRGCWVVDLILGKG
jgi:hypothetical protein